jgi:hypothetical protein
MAEATAGALQIVQTQQNLVGRTVVGGASAVTGQAPDKVQVGILEQIRDITLKSFRATTNIAKTLVDSLNFEKNKAARERDQAAELSKESGVIGESKGVGDAVTKAQGDAEKEGGKFVFFMGGLGKLFGTILKPFKSLMNFVMKIGPIARLFTALGPAASGLLRFTGIGTIIFLLVKYGDEILKALEPVLSAIGKTFEILKPVLTPIITVLDFLIKGAINQIGNIITAFVNVFNGALSFIVDALGGVIDIVTGLFTLDFAKVGEGFKKIGNTILNALKNIISSIIDAIPFVPQKFKDKIKSAIGVGEIKEVPSEADKQSSTGDVKSDDKDKKELSSAFSSIEEKPATVAEKIEKPTIKEETPKPKTMNMDKTTSVVEVAQKIEGDPNLPPLGLNMYKLKGETYEERATQYQAFKEALIKAHKDGIISEEETKFRAMRLKGEKDSLARVKRIIDIRKQKVELTGQPFDESALLSESDTDRAAIQKQTLAEEGMTETSFNEALTNKLKPNVNRRDLASQTQTAGITVVNNQPTTVSSQNSVARSEVMVSRPSASTGDPYLDKQNYAVT